MASLKCEVQEQIREGCGLSWESYKLENFVQKFSDCIFNFQEKVDDVLSYTDKIDMLVSSLETCEYRSPTFKDLLDKIQKHIDDLNLRSYSNLVAWVGELDEQVRTCTNNINSLLTLVQYVLNSFTSREIMHTASLLLIWYRFKVYNFHGFEVTLFKPKPKASAHVDFVCIT